MKYSQGTNKPCGNESSNSNKPASAIWLRDKPPWQTLPEFLIHKTVSKINDCFKPLSFDVVCYTTVDNYP